MIKKSKRLTKRVESSMVQKQILYYLYQYLTISQISKLRKTSRTAVYNTVNKLIEQKKLRKIGGGYEITEKGLHFLNGSCSKQIRLHNLAFKIYIFNKPRNWELRRNKIVQTRVLSKRINLTNNYYEIHSFSNIKVKTTNNSIIFYMPYIYGNNTDECFKQALDYLWDSISKIEHLFKIILIKERKCNMEIISQHYAKLQDSLAKIYKIENNKLYVKDDLGDVWLICDYSFRVNELETINKITAKEDMDIVQNFLNDLRKNPVTFSNVLQLIREVAGNQLIYSKNWESHLGIYKSINKQVGSLNKGIKKLNKLVGNVLKENKKLKLGDQKQLGEYLT
ncbi:MAG: hypothetical protein ACFFHD_05600 [Promethearchaeota archaeon]